MAITLDAGSSTAAGEERALRGETVLSVRDAALVYGHAGRGGKSTGKNTGKTVLDKVSLDIREGEFVVVLGASGSGKTSLLRLLAGYIQPSGGTVEALGRPAAPTSEVGVVFQHANLFPWLTLRGNVEFGLRMKKLGRQARRQSANTHLALVGLAEFGDYFPHQLSGGMKQRCAIARTLAAESRILLMDEPFGALDAITRESLQALMKSLWRQAGLTVFFITHDVDEALYLGTRIIVMNGAPACIGMDEANPLLGGEESIAGVRRHRDYGEARERLLRELGK